MITTGSQITADLDLTAEVCVIGSGAGGAVVAKELAEAGRDVVLLEQGGHYTKDDFTQREDEMMPLLYEDMGQRATVDQIDHDPAGPQRRRLDRAQPLLLLPHAGADPREVAARRRRARPGRGRPAAVVRARRADAEGQADPARRGQHAQQQDPPGLREARLQRLRHQPQPRELHAVRLLPARLPVRRQAEHADHLHPGRRPRRRAHLRQLRGAAHRQRGRARAPRRGRGGRRARPPAAPLHASRRRSSSSAPARSTRRRCCCTAASPTPTGGSGAICICTRACCCRAIYDEDIYGYRGIPQSYYVDEFIDLETRSRQRLHPDAGLRLPGDDGDAAARASAARTSR